VCYDFTAQLANLAGVSIVMPEPGLLGVLKKPAPFAAFWTWWQETLTQYPKSPMILALDTLAYGGLIASRVNPEPLQVLEGRVADFMSKVQETQRPRYGFSSILRIPNYNNAEEEPDYWEMYGRLLYEFSEKTHRDRNVATHVAEKIPDAILGDFLGRRQKNFGLNKRYLDFLKNRTLDYLVYCQDDTGQYGMNVKEADILSEQCAESNLQGVSMVQTGADEVALTLLSRTLWQAEGKPLKVYPWYFPGHAKKTVALFDGVPIGQVVQRQIQTAGGMPCLTPEDADVVLVVHGPTDQMGDHCSPRKTLKDPRYRPEMLAMLKEWIPKKAVVLADVAFANGADPDLMAHCQQEKVPLGQLAGFAAWNTPGNTIGSALAMGSVAFWAMQKGSFNAVAHRTLLRTRFLDDWIYQVEVRTALRRAFQNAMPETSVLNEQMAEGVARVDALIGCVGWPVPQFSFPCGRLFEVAVHGQS